MGINTDSIRLRDATLVQILTDAVTVTTGYHELEPETGNTDDLATINVGILDLDVANVDYAPMIVLRATAAATITLKHGTGNILLNRGGDFDITGSMQVLLMYNLATDNWTDLGIPLSPV